MASKNWMRKKPDDWDEYQWEYLRTLNGLSYQLKVLGDRLDAIDSSTSSEVLAEIVNSSALEILRVVERNNGYYSTSNTTSYSGFYNGSEN